jgi:hypothetical protein
VRGALAISLVLLVAASGALACRRARDASVRPAPAGPSPPPALAARLSLPETLAGFAAVTPPVTGPGWVRRSFRRGNTQVEVALAEASLGPGGFDAWLTMSRAFPQAALDAPAGDANGFYQCVSFPMSSCDLLIQLRSGVHVELRGNGSSSRADVDALAAGLPLRALAAPPASAAASPP